MITRSIGRLVRVKMEVEELIRKVSEYVGYNESTVRNVAILYGLQLIIRGAKIPEYDEEFEKLLESTREDVRKFVIGKMLEEKIYA